jgi:hypothetical protein
VTAPSGKRTGRIACFSLEIGWALAALCMGLAALWMTAHRHEGYDVRCSRASDLYQLSEAPRISNYSVDAAGLLTIEVENLEETAWIRLEEGREEAVIDGKNPAIQLAPGISHTRLKGRETGRVLDFSTQWVPGQPNPLVSHGALRVGEPSPYSIMDFVTPGSAYPAEQVGAARELIPPRVLDESMPVTERVALLAAMLHANLEPHRGSPAPYMARLNGFEQYQEAMGGGSKIYCANHAEIFAFMANAAGLPTRLVDVAGQVGDVAVGAHSFVETYIGEESRWIYVDLQLGIAGVKDAGGLQLSAAELLERIRRGTTESLITRTLRDHRVVDEPWSFRADLFETFLTPEASLVFLTSAADRFAPFERIKRLLVSPRAAICEGGLPNGAIHRLVLTWLAIGFGALWVLVRARHYAGFCRCRVEGGATIR